jgi:phage-related minor tail protein
VANIERITAAMERQQALAESLNQIRKEGNQAIADAEAEGAQAALTPLQRQIDVITRGNQKAAQQAAESFAKQFEGMDMTVKQSQELADGLDLITQKYYKLTEVQVKNLNSSRSFATGWKKAFDEYVDAATNAAAKAERLFMKFTSGIEDALVDFVKTGKLNWKSFVADMAEELLRNQIKETIASFGQALGLGSIFGGSSSGAAIGSSPSKPMYVVDITGGGTGASGTGGSILDSILGGNKSGSSGGGFFDGILNVGKSIFGGISDLFGGFFANGGNIPAGKFGIVGERGPEFVGGPASVMPMGGGGGQVTYIINATDAASFQALVARDPGFIHSVAELGRSRSPGARR